MNFSRYLEKHIQQDISEKMVFIGGPRQVGKTTLAKKFINGPERYLNWDFDKDRRLILRDQINTEGGLIVFDEIHKYKKWRGLVKGYFDKFFPDINFIVTGSARLDHFRKGGDSLVGRYHYWRLHPLTLCEMAKNPNGKDLEQLLKFGGFPEPLIKQSSASHGRWQMQRVSRVVQQDLRDLETVKDLSLVELLVSALPERVGSQLSIKSLQEDLQVSPNTVDRWIQLLEQVYYCYRIFPYGPAKLRTVKKTPKLYLWDWSEAQSSGAVFENLVAGHLLKFCHYQEDCFGLKTELRYFKDVVTGQEIDFVVLQKGKPIFTVECKSGDRQMSPHFLRNSKKISSPKIFQVHTGTKDYGHESSGRVLPFTKFCLEIGIP